MLSLTYHASQVRKFRAESFCWNKRARDACVPSLRTILRKVEVGVRAPRTPHD